MRYLPGAILALLGVVLFAFTMVVWAAIGICDASCPSMNRVIPYAVATGVCFLLSLGLFVWARRKR